jgi:glycosyltransferase involved in cell wall biosynthesis
MANPSPPIRIVHVLGSLVGGGIETWLMNVLRHLDRDLFTIDIVVSSLSRSPLMDEAEALGSQIHVCLAHSQQLRFATNLTRTFQSKGPYDIIHGNLHFLNGVVAFCGALSGAPVRIVHSHTRSPFRNLSPAERVKNRAARSLLRTFANGALACSSHAGAELFGSDWNKRFHGRVLQCGIDLAAFRQQVDRKALRASLGIPRDALVIGHAGRFVPEKNHAFFLKVVECYAERNPRAHFLLVGDGPLLPEVKRQAALFAGANRFHFLGTRYDVPALMSGAMDCFLFPSLFEGLGLALVEAQAAGLPCVYSDVIPPEADIFAPLLSRVSLNASVEEWCNAIDAAILKQTPDLRALALAAVDSSPFNAGLAIQELQKYYLWLYGEKKRAQAFPSAVRSEKF